MNAEVPVPTNLTKELAERILVQGELRLKAQLAIALAADTRAITAVSVLIGVASGLLGFAGLIYSNHDIGNQPLEISAFATAVMLLASAAICLFAALPTEFRTVGANPENWWDDDVTSRPYEEALWRESLNYAARIKQNLRTIQDNAHLFRAGMVIALCAPIAGLFLWVVVVHAP